MTGTAIQSDMRVVMIPAKSRDEIQRTTRLKVAVYCRVSTDQEEQESSYEAQISYYTDKICNNTEWQLAGIFADEGITGTQAKKRPEFMKMIRLCRQRKIDMILTKSLSRFARNTVECLKYIRDLKALGIAIVFEKENLNTLETDTEMMLTIMSCFAQAESESISKNVAWGIRQSFKNGNVPMQYARLLGYRKGENELPEIVPDEAEIVREIFRRYLDGASMEQIADSLNCRGLTTKGSGSPYRKIAIQRILTNEKYTGDALLQKTYITDCITKKSRKNNGELPMYLVKNHHEAIISRADFNRVQEEMARRSAKRVIADKLTKTEQGKYSAKYALSELLICGECGSHYRRVTWTAKGFKEIKWRCISRIQYGKKKCHCSPTVDEQALHKAIVSTINEFCMVKDDVAQVLRESITEILDPNLNGSIQAAQQRIDELARNIDELIKLATVPETAAAAMSDIARFSDEMKTLREFIETEKAKQATTQRGSAELDAVLNRLENEDFTMTEYDDVAVRQLIDKITVESKDTVTVAFKGGFEMRKGLNGD
ncbi:MAG: recombinase family protein [Lachnospiraceae bacterium]|nr:recombinase family protein [Ruminococcus sp.]MCM1276528.1 recombinase family protein [Lachnospiraceae bacterium]